MRGEGETMGERARGLGLEVDQVCVIVPIAADDLGVVLRQGRSAAQAETVDAIEWRVDYHADLSPEWGADAARRVRDAVGERPLLATVRTTREGGRADLNDDAYASLVEAMCAWPLDAVDIEARRPGADELLAHARAGGIESVASMHDFAGTLSTREIAQFLEHAQAMGADVVKVAQTMRDADAVVDYLALVRAHARAGRAPLIAAPMGPLGAPARLTALSVGAAATFACLDAATAPGQVPAGALAPLIAAMRA